MIHTVAQCVCVNRNDYLAFLPLDYIACFGCKIEIIQNNPKTEPCHHLTNPFKHHKIKIRK